MLRKYFVLITMAANLIAGAITAPAQEAGALLDLLVKKRIITDQEAEEVRGELNKEFSQSPAGKMKLSTPLTELEIYGDARVRYEVRNGNSGPRARSSPTPMTRSSATGIVTVCASVFAASWWTTGSSAFASRPARAIARPT